MPATADVPRLTRKGEATRRRLLDAAAAELAAHGNAEVSSVARSAGVVPSVLYRYFDGKDALIAAVVHDFYDQYDAEVFEAPIQPDSSWSDRETERLRREIGFLYAHPLGHVIAAGLLHEAAATRADAERQRAHTEAAARNIRHGQRTGELASEIDAGLAGAATIGALRALLADALSRTPPAPQDEVFDAFQRVGAALLTRPGATRQR
jgi:AcrR family transcriptional regulator